MSLLENPLYGFIGALEGRNCEKTTSTGGEKTALSPTQCTVSQVDRNNVKIAQIILWIASPSTVLLTILRNYWVMCLVRESWARIECYIFSLLINSESSCAFHDHCSSVSSGMKRIFTTFYYCLRNFGSPLHSGNKWTIKTVDCKGRTESEEAFVRNSIDSIAFFSQSWFQMWT